jgi:hypothetical protein
MISSTDKAVRHPSTLLPLCSRHFPRPLNSPSANDALAPDVLSKSVTGDMTYACDRSLDGGSSGGWLWFE